MTLYRPQEPSLIVLSIRCSTAGMNTDWNLSLRCGDALELVRQMPDDSVDCVVTSPPYYGLRTYGTETWQGGEADCRHCVGGQVQDSKTPGAITAGIRPGVDATHCIDCGARRVDRQYGLETLHDCLGWATGVPCGECFVCHLVELFREIRRVLKKGGTCWLNLGDSYAAQRSASAMPAETLAGGVHGKAPLDGPKSDARRGRGSGPRMHRDAKRLGLKHKDLMGMPWRVALALQADGWWLRQDIIWRKKNPLPESVRDRCTKSHEYIFLLTKSAKYHYDRHAIAEPAKWERWGDQTEKKQQPGGAKWLAGKTREELQATGMHRGKPVLFGGNKYKQAYADGDETARSEDRRSSCCRARTKSGNTYKPQTMKNKRDVWTLPTHGFKGAHFATFAVDLPTLCIRAGCKPGGVVLDPFCGSGTTGIAALREGRRAILLDLSPEYIAMARDRITAEAPLFVKEQIQ